MRLRVLGDSCLSTRYDAGCGLNPSNDAGGAGTRSDGTIPTIRHQGAFGETDELSKEILENPVSLAARSERSLPEADRRLSPIRTIQARQGRTRAGLVVTSRSKLERLDQSVLRSFRSETLGMLDDVGDARPEP